MNEWIKYTPYQLFELIPDNELNKIIAEKTNNNQHNYDALKDYYLLNTLLTKFILNKNKTPMIITEKNHLIKWLLILFLFE